jgi:hypothetical protein
MHLLLRPCCVLAFAHPPPAFHSPCVARLSLCLCLRPPCLQIHNVDVLFREDVTVDEFIDVVLGNRVYLRCLYVINKSQQQQRTAQQASGDQKGCRGPE